MSRLCSLDTNSEAQSTQVFKSENGEWRERRKERSARALRWQKCEHKDPLAENRTRVKWVR